MFRKSSTVALVASAFSIAALAACAVQTPLTPTSPGSPGSASAPDGSTLKVGPPTPVSPINDALVTSTAGVTLTVSKPAVQFADANQPFSYEFELQNDAGTVLARTTTSQNVTSATFNTTLTPGVAYRWRARALIGAESSPYSSVVRFQTPRLQTPTVADNNDVWRNWFGGIPYGQGGLIALRGVGPTLTVAALTALKPDLDAAGVLMETNSQGQVRGRIYLPTGNPNNLYARTVDLGDFGGPWRWENKGASTCEGGSCK